MSCVSMMISPPIYGMDTMERVPLKLTEIFNHFRSETSSARTFLLITIIGCSFVLTITMIRSAITGITYDEAVTYLNYSQDFSDFLKIESANNHPLNSLLIYLTSSITGQKYNEFIIRLPSIFAFCLYLFSSYKVSRLCKYSLFTFSILVLNYYLNEYFGLARGYGLAAAFNLAGFTIYFFNRNKEKYILCAMILLTLASTSIFSNLALVLSFTTFVIFFDLEIKNLWAFIRKNLIVLVILSGLYLYSAYVFYQVTQEGLPLYGYKGINIFKAIPLSFIGMFTSNNAVKLASALLGVLFFGVGFLRNIKNIKKIPFSTILLLNFLIILLLSAVLKKPLPTNRVLIPLYPLLALSFSELLTKITDAINSNKMKILINVCLVLASFLLILNYTGAINLTYTTDWKDDYSIRDRVYLAAITKPQSFVEWTPVDTFYVLQLENRLHMDKKALFTSP